MRAVISAAFEGEVPGRATGGGPPGRATGSRTWSRRCVRRCADGTGSQLVRHALAEVAAGSLPLVFLEGSPGYYPRFGFVPGRTLGITAPSVRMPDAAFQVVRLRKQRGPPGGRVLAEEPRREESEGDAEGHEGGEDRPGPAGGAGELEAVLGVERGGSHDNYSSVPACRWHRTVVRLELCTVEDGRVPSTASGGVRPDVSGQT